MADENKPTPKASKPAAGKYFDVTPAKETVAPATSRPVIVGHSSGMQKDPMVSASTEFESVSEEAKLAMRREKVLDPVTPISSSTPDTEDLPSGNQTVAAEVAETAKADDSQETPVEYSSSGDSQQQSSSDNQESGAVDAIVSEVNTKKEREKDEDERLKKEVVVAELAASKKYYLKIQTPATKRKARLMVVLLITLIVGGIGWYFGVGPGVEMWSKDVTSQSTATPAVETPAATTSETAQQPKTSPKATFAEAKLGLAFSYPSDWKVAQAKDTEYATRDVITISSPAEKLTILGANDAPLDAEVFFRTRIFVQNTTSTREYASDLVKMTACTSEDIIVAGSTMKLLFVDYKKLDPAVSQLALSPENCVRAGNLFNGNDQLQFASKKNTFVVYSELIFSEDHLKKNGATTPEAIALAQEKGVAITKTNLLKSTQYSKFKEVLSSLREEIAP